ncbi:MAG: hypothetical protein ACI83D_000403 [Planctomycetota bacterium]
MVYIKVDDLCGGPLCVLCNKVSIEEEAGVIEETLAITDCGQLREDICPCRDYKPASFHEKWREIA